MWGLGVNGRDYTPAKFGRDWEATTILKPVSHLRDDFTLISGLKLTHSGGHGGERTFLTGTATHKADAKVRISADQELAEAVGKVTRFPSLVLGVYRGTGFGCGTIDKTLAWTRGGTPVPAENRPNVIFDKLFRAESPEEVAARRIGAGRTGNVLDAMRDEGKSLQNRLGKDDQAKLEEYMLVWGSSGGTVNAHNNTDLPTMLVGGHKIGIKHQGHIAKKDVRLGNLWQTMFGSWG